LAVENLATRKIAVWDDRRGEILLVGRLVDRGGRWRQISFRIFKEEADIIGGVYWKDLIYATV
jgi:hypothetical protein